MKNLQDIEKHSIVSPPSHLPPYGWHTPYQYEEEVSLIDYFRVIKKHGLKIILITLLFSGLGAGLTFKMSKKYQATASLMLLTQSGGGGLAVLASQFTSLPLVGGQLSGLAGIAGGQKGGQLISILKSRTFSEKIINEFNLLPVLFKNKWDPTTNHWKVSNPQDVPVMEDAVSLMQKKIITVQDDKKTGLIKINVEMKDPHLAAQVANQMLIELQDFINKNQLTVAKRNRIFVEEQLQKNKAELLEAGKKLNQFYNNNRISSVLPQLDVNIGKMEGLPKTFDEFRAEISRLEGQKQELKDKLKEEANVVVQGVPSQVYLQYLTLQRELLGRVNALLAQQYEIAKIEEAKEDLSFQIIDKAVPPVRPSKPQVLMNIAISFTAGLLFSLFLAFFIEYIRKLKEAEKVKRAHEA